MLAHEKSKDVSHPTCVGIIMDGNRRWAKENAVSAYEGHSEGYKKLKEIMSWAREGHISHVVIYAFSTENWQRSEEEVNYLMQIFRFILKNEIKNMVDKGVRVRFIGDITRFPDDIRNMIKDAETQIAATYDITLHLAVSYGGRAEIVAGVNALLTEGATTLTEESFAEKLWSHDMPDPDLIIRTGGEKRLSNFLPWQSVYSELFFTDTKWPAFTKEEFNAILAEFSTRERRRGK